MKVTGQEEIERCGRRHADSRSQLQSWLNEAKVAEWQSSHDIRERFNTASFIGHKNIVFNIKGGAYRLWTIVDYQHQVIIVKKAGTHSEYETWRIS